MNYICIGRLEEIKGTKILLEAWNILGSNAPELIICGNGNLMKWCQNYIQEHNLLKIKLKGYVEHNLVLKLLENSCALIFPTQVYEGFPVSIIEAFSKKIPVIGSNIGNVASIIDDTRTGLLFQFDSAEDLALKIKYFMSLDLITMKKNAYEKYISLYTAESNYKKLIEIYTNANFE